MEQGRWNEPPPRGPRYDPEMADLLMAEIKIMHSNAKVMIRFNFSLALFNVGLSMLLLLQLAAK